MYHLYAEVKDQGTLTLQNITFSDTSIKKAKAILLLDNDGGDITVNNITFSDIVVESDVGFWRIYRAGTSQINSLTFTNLKPLSSSDVSNTLIEMVDLSSTYNSNITFNSINVHNTTISVIKISNSSQSKTITQYITFNDLSIHDNDYSFSDNLILTENIKSDSIFEIIFNRLQCYDLNFTANSNILQLGHQSNEQLQIIDSSFTDIYYGGITIKAFDQSSELVSKVFFRNISAHEIDVYFR